MDAADKRWRQKQYPATMLRRLKALGWMEFEMPDQPWNWLFVKGRWTCIVDTRHGENTFTYYPGPKSWSTDDR